MSKKSKDRKQARRDAVRSQVKDRDEGGGFKYKLGYVVDEKDLDDLGISEFRPANDKDKAVVNKLHILPSHDDDFDDGLVGIALGLFIHQEVGADGTDYLCPKWMRKVYHDAGATIPEEIEDGRCPVCEEYERALQRFFDAKDKDTKDGYYDEQKALRAFSGRWNKPRPKRLLAFVVDAHDEDSEEEGTKYWIMPPSIYDGGILEQVLDADNLEDDGQSESGVIDILETGDNGYIFQFKVDPETSFDMYKGFKLKKRKLNIEEDAPEWLEAVPKYSDLLVFHTYDQIKEALEDSDGDEGKKAIDQAAEDWQDEENEKSSRKKRRRNKDDDEEEDKPKRKRKREVVEDEDEDEDDDNPDDECIACEGTGKSSKGRTCRPCKGTGVATPKPKDDDDDEEEDKPKRRRRSSEDDEEEKPKRKRKRKHNDDDEPDEDEDKDEDDDDDDSDVGKVRRRRRERKAAKDDDDDSPKRKRRRSKRDEDD